MWRPMEGVKVLEVAQFTFTPRRVRCWPTGAPTWSRSSTPSTAMPSAASQSVRGARRPVPSSPSWSTRIGASGASAWPSKCRVGARCSWNWSGLQTSSSPTSSQTPASELGIDAEDISAINPNIIYVRGSGHGQRGPEADRPGYDGSTFWSRMGCAWGVTPPDSGRLLGQPSGAFGDSMGGAMMAGGVAAALFARERTGEGSIVDVSLMSVGAWAMALWLGTAMLTGVSTPPLADDSADAHRRQPDDWQLQDRRWTFHHAHDAPTRSLLRRPVSARRPRAAVSKTSASRPPRASWPTPPRSVGT